MSRSYNPISPIIPKENTTHQKEVDHYLHQSNIEKVQYFHPITPENITTVNFLN